MNYAALIARARRYARRQPSYEGINGQEIASAIATAYAKGFRAAERISQREAKAPAAVLLHVLDNQRALKAKIHELTRQLKEAQK